MCLPVEQLCGKTKMNIQWHRQIIVIIVCISCHKSVNVRLGHLLHGQNYLCLQKLVYFVHKVHSAFCPQNEKHVSQLSSQQESSILFSVERMCSLQRRQAEGILAMNKVLLAPHTYLTSYICCKCNNSYSE